MGIRSVLAEWQNLIGGKKAEIVEEADGTLNMYLGSTSAPVAQGNPVAKMSTDANGNFTGLIDPKTGAIITVGGSGTTLSAATIAALKAIDISSVADGTPCNVAGYYADQDGGEGVFVYRSTSSATANNGTVIQPNTGSGRWLRLRSNAGQFFVNWYGAKPSNNTADATTNTTAIQAAITDAVAYATNTAINGFNSKVIFGSGSYYTNGLNLTYADCALEGQGSGVTRLIHAASQNKPVIYLSGGNRVAAAPYGGVHNMTVIAGSGTYPANVYYDTAIDNQINLDDLSFSGTSANTRPVDGFSCHNFLNMTIKRSRSDAVSGYSFRFRRATESTSSGSTTTNSYQKYQWTTYDSTTGVITFAATSSEVPNGSSVLLFTTGVAPTRTSTSAALKLANTGTRYFLGNTTETSCTLHDTESDARAGINPILLTAATGSGTHQFCVFMASFPVTATASNTFTFTNDKNILIPTAATTTPSFTQTYGSGNTTPITVAGQTGIRTIMVTVPETGTLDSALVAGTIYYPIYVDAFNIKLASSLANALAGTAITLNNDGANMTLIYDCGVSVLGIGALAIGDCTYDNNNCTTLETVGGIACGGLGFVFADYCFDLNKGVITLTGSRMEINKQLAKDTVFGKGEASFIRIESGRQDLTAGINGLSLKVKDMVFDTSTSLRGETIRAVANRGNKDVSPVFENVKGFNIGTLYNNDRGTAFSKSMSMGYQRRFETIRSSGAEYGAAGTTGRLDSTYFNSVTGRQTGMLQSSQSANSWTKRGDLLTSGDVGVAFYQAVQTSTGFTKGTGATSATGTSTVSATAGDKVFTLSAFVPNTEAVFGNGVSITIPGAGVAAANITGVVANYRSIGTSLQFELHDETTGALIPCSTTVSGVTATYNATALAKVPTLHSGSGALDFPSIAANTSSDLTLAAPTGVTLTAGKVVRLGLPSNVPAGVVYNGFVTAGGATVTVRAFNVTTGAIDPASGTFTYEVDV